LPILSRVSLLKEKTVVILVLLGIKWIFLKKKMTKISSNFEDVISNYVPEQAVREVIRLWEENPYQLTVASQRKTKKGDFRARIKGNVHYISVNYNLNSYEFLLVLIHEYAHLMVWKIYGRNAKPHGEEWKDQFRTYMLPFFKLVDFPPKLGIAMLNYLRNPKASSGSDINLQKEFAKFDPPSDEVLVEDLKDGELFFYNFRVFKKGKKLRTRYLCEEVLTKSKYRFSPLAPVELYESV